MNEQQLDIAKEHVKQRVNEVDKSLPVGTSETQRNRKKTKKVRSDVKVLQVNNLQVSFRTYGGEVEAVRGLVSIFIKGKHWL